MSNPFEPPAAHNEAGHVHDGEGPGVRHGCLTAWLVLMLVANSVASLANLAMSASIRAAFPAMPPWGPFALAILGVVNVVCAIALFRWRKWGFFGFAVTSVVAAWINTTAGLSGAQIAAGLVGLGILFAVLQLGEPSGWKQLR